MDIKKFIYAGNLPFDATEELLDKEFSEVGTVVKTVLGIDLASGRFRGFGFVEMEKAEDVDAAIKKLQNKEIKGASGAGRNMYLELAESEMDLWKDVFEGKK